MANEQAEPREGASNSRTVPQAREDSRERVGLASSIKPGSDADAASRAKRRTMRERLNDKAARQALVGVVATLLGGSFWGFSGTSASFLFANYEIDTMWLMAVRQFCAGAAFMVVVLLFDRGGSFWGFSGTSASFLFANYEIDTMWLMAVRQFCAGAAFMVVVLLFDRARFRQLLTTPRDLVTLGAMAVFGVFFNQLFYLLAVRLTNAGTATVLQCLQLQLLTTPRDLVTLGAMAVFGVFFNQLFYLLAVRLTNAGTATVLQCLQLVLIMAFSCVRQRRAPRRREIAGVVLAFGGTFLIATGGDPTRLAIPFDGLAVGLIAAFGAACMTIIPGSILPKYGSSIVTGTAMFASGIVTSLFVQPWNNVIAAFGAACMTIIPGSILPKYGSSIVTGTAMFASGIVTSLFVQPWNNVPTLDAAGWGALIVLIFVGSCLAYALYMQGVKDIGSVRASLIGTVEPVSATVTSALLLGTVFAPTDLIGFACIIIMVFLTV